MKVTPFLKTSEIKRDWYILDASTNSLGRISTKASKILTGKHKNTYTPHIDNGDHVIILNANKLRVTGNKLSLKKYYRHSGHPGSLKIRTLSEQIDRVPDKVIYNSVRGMLAVNKLRKGRLARLHIFLDDKHSHEGQKPIIDKEAK